MEDSRDSNEAHNTGAGQAVNVVIGSHSLKWVIIGFLVLIGLLFWTDHVASKAAMKAEAAVTSANNAADEFRLTQFWVQRASVACENSGVTLPPLPAAAKAN